MKKLLKYSFIYLIMSLIMGAFYREFTKLMSFNSKTMLSIVHTHIFMLGLIVMFVLYL